jgi:hypothetical protein
MVQISEDVQQREKEVRDYIELFAGQFELDPNLVRALITQESRFVAEATSPTGAYGYGQFTGIGAKQVRQIAKMHPRAADLDNFTKSEASLPIKGIKAICATLWWLFYRKYADISDKKIQLEAALTFYNAGGRPAALIVRHGGHAEALPFITTLPKNYQGGAVTYAPEVCLWYVAWHELEKKDAAPEVAVTVPDLREANPFDARAGMLDVRYRALLEALKLVDEEDTNVNLVIDVREGWTEVTLILPGEY